ncbi:hypothetical protein J7643_14565 [bacterium]|nr:hypothetical protein [bacterium]
MRRIVPMAAGLLLLTSAGTASAASLTTTDRTILNALAEATAVSGGSKGILWPGFDLSTQPFALYDRGRLTLLVNHPRPPQGFVPVADVPTLLKGHVHQRAGSLDALDRAQDLTVPLGGVKVAFIPYMYLTYDGQVQPREFIPPLFSAHTREAFAGSQVRQRMAEAASRAYPSRNVENTALANLENRILAIALLQSAADKRREYGRFFLAVRKSRHAMLDGRIARYEDATERLQGAMRYTETAATLAGSAPTHRPLPGTRWEREADDDRMLISRLSQPLDSEETRQSRLSATGTAMGLILDRLGDASWKQRVTRGASITEAFATGMGYRDRDTAALFAEAKRRFAYDELRTAAQDATLRFPASYKEFIKNPGARITVTGLVRVMDGGSDKPGPDLVQMDAPNPPIEIDEQTLLAYRLDGFRYRKGGIGLELKRTPMLMKSHSLSWPFEQVVFFADEDALKIETDGRRLPLQDGTYAFKRSLKLMAGNRVTLTATQGILKISGKELSLQLTK